MRFTNHPSPLVCLSILAALAMTVGCLPPTGKSSSNTTVNNSTTPNSTLPDGGGGLDWGEFLEDDFNLEDDKEKKDSDEFEWGGFLDAEPKDADKDVTEDADADEGVKKELPEESIR